SSDIDFFNICRCQLCNSNVIASNAMITVPFCGIERNQVQSALGYYDHTPNNTSTAAILSGTGRDATNLKGGPQVQCLAVFGDHCLKKSGKQPQRHALHASCKGRAFNRIWRASGTTRPSYPQWRAACCR